MSGAKKTESRRATVQWLHDQELGKLPPQDVEIEKAILGAFLQDAAAYQHMGLVKPEHFYMPQHAEVMSAIQEMHLRGVKIDILTITSELRKRGTLQEVGGPLYISKLTDGVSGSANMHSHILILIEKWMAREMISIGGDMSKSCFDGTEDVFVVQEKNQKRLLEVANVVNARSAVPLSKVLYENIDRIQSNREKRGLTGCPTGYAELDNLTGGWQQSNVIVVAGRPGMGKTAVALNLALRPAMHYGKKILFLSLEMSTRELVNRLISMCTGIVGNNLAASYLDKYEWQRLSMVGDYLNLPNLVIDDTPRISLMQLQAKAYKMKYEMGLDMIVLDYLQLMAPENSNQPREAQITQLSAGIKATAKQLDVPIIELSQLSRDVEKRGGARRPQLSDLRESGSIEQDADIVSFVYRPGYYGITEDHKGNAYDSNHLELIVAKHRNGGLLDVAMKGILPVTRVLGRIPDALSPEGFRYETEKIYMGEKLWQMENELSREVSPDPDDKPF